jgi:cytochrome c-type biogenesis protein CcmH
MNNDLSNGLLTQEMYDQGKQELQSRLLDDVEHIKGIKANVATNPFRALALVLAILLPLSATAIYLKIGNQDALRSQQSASTSNFAVAHTAEELAALEEKVSGKPDDANSWYLLAQSYGETGRYPDAVNAYDKLTQLVPNEAQLWADYADSMAMASGKSLLGKPTILLDKALQLDPGNFKALALSGSAAMERKDFAVAIRHWEKLLKMIPKDNENAQIVEGGLQQARELMAQKNGGKLPPATQFSSSGTQTATGAGKEAISGTVTLSNELKAIASPDDTVFVLVRAASGPKMPLAIVRKQVKDLPLKFTLDDSTSMSPQMKVSNFDQVVVIARISKSGNAMTQSGDMQVMSAIIKPGSKGLKLKIDQLVQ